MVINPQEEDWEDLVLRRMIKKKMMLRSRLQLVECSRLNLLVGYSLLKMPLLQLIKMLNHLQLVECLEPNLKVPVYLIHQLPLLHLTKMVNPVLLQGVQVDYLAINLQEGDLEDLVPQRMIKKKMLLRNHLRLVECLRLNLLAGYSLHLLHLLRLPKMINQILL